MGKRDAAIFEYELALNKYSNINMLKSPHINNKLFKILNDYIDLLYDKEDYDKIDSTINSYINDFLNKDNKLTEFIQTMKNEVALLRMLKEKSFNPEYINIQETSRPFYNMLNLYFNISSI